MSYFVPGFLAALKENELHTLFRSGQKSLYAKNTIIIKEGDDSNCAYFINSGKVKIYIAGGQDHKIILDVLNAGEYFGEMSLIDNQNRSATVKAVEDTELTVISQDAFRACMQSHPDVAGRIMLGLVTRLREADHKISSLALMSVHERVANMLLGLARDQDGQLVVAEKLTHQDIANSVGASREMVTRILKKMTSDGLIRIEGKRIIISSLMNSSMDADSPLRLIAGLQ